MKKKDQGYWKVTLFEPDAKHELAYDPGWIEFQNEKFPEIITKTMTWAKGEGPYRRKDYKVPTLLNVWNFLNSKTPDCQSFIFDKWVIQREYECFRYQLMDIIDGEVGVFHTNIWGDDLASRLHFIEFIYMLRKTKYELDKKRDRKLIDYSRIKDRRIESMFESMCDDLDKVLGME